MSSRWPVLLLLGLAIHLSAVQLESPLPFTGGGIVADPEREVVYVIDRDEPAILALSTETGRPVARGRLRHAEAGRMAVTADGRSLVVALPGMEALQRLALPGLVDEGLVPLGFVPGDIAAAAAGGVLVVADDIEFSLRRIDPITGVMLGFSSRSVPPGMMLSSGGATTAALERWPRPGVPGAYRFATTGTDPELIAELDAQPNAPQDLADGGDVLYIADAGEPELLALFDDGRREAWSAGVEGVPMAVALDRSHGLVWAGWWQGWWTDGLVAAFAADGTLVEAFASGAILERGIAVTPAGRVVYLTQVGTIGAIGLPELDPSGWPQAVASADPEIGAPPLQVRLDGTGSTGAAAFTWMLPGGATATGAIVETALRGHGGLPVTLEVVDGAGLRDWATVTVVVNTPPVAPDATLTTAEEEPIQLAPRGSDADGDPVMTELLSWPTSGDLVWHGDATWTYVPRPGFSGEARLTYRVSDPWVQSAPGTVRILVTPVDDPPIAQDRSLVVVRDEPTPLRLAATDEDSTRLRFAIVEQPRHGRLERSAEGSYVYHPRPNHPGTDRLRFTARDASSTSAPATVSITVVAPDRVGDAWTTLGNGAAHTGHQPVSGTAIGAFARAWSRTFDGQAAQPAIAGGRLFTTVAGGQDGRRRLVALAAADGGEIWSLELSQAHALSAPTIDRGRVYVQRNNHQTDSQVLAFDPHGRAVWSAPYEEQWQWHYAPTPGTDGVYVQGGYEGGFLGFRRSNGRRLFQVGPGGLHDPAAPSLAGATLVIRVGAQFTVRDRLTGAQLWQLDLGPSPIPSQVPVIAGQLALLTDIDPASRELTVTAVDLARRTIAWRTATGETSWRARQLPATDGTMAVVPVDAGLVALDLRDGARRGLHRTAGRPLGTQPLVTDDRRFVSTEAGVEIFAADAWYPRQTLPVRGELALARGTLYVSGHEDWTVSAWRIVGGNRPPVFAPAPVATTEDTPVTIALTAQDPEGASLTWSLARGPARGTLLGEPPALVYVPGPDVHGEDVLAVTVSDGELQTTAEVRVVVAPVNDAPLAHDRRVVVRVDTELALPGLASDVDGDTLTLRLTEAPLHGTVRFAGADAWYLPEAGFDGVDAFAFVADDGALTSTPGRVSLVVERPVEGSWSGAGGGAGRTGHVPTTGLGPFEAAWRVDLFAGQIAHPAFGQGLVYLVPKGNVEEPAVVALDAITGAEVWRRAFAADLLNPPTYHDGRVYVQRLVHPATATLLALDAATGATVWETAHVAEYQEAANPTVAGDLVVVPGGSAGMTAMRVADGAVVATATGGGARIISADHGDLASGTISDWQPELVISGAEDLAERWRTELPGWIDHGIALADGRAYLIAGSTLMAFDLSTGEMVWSDDWGWMGRPAVADGTVYARTSDGIVAFSAATGERGRVYPAGSAAYYDADPQPIVAGDLLIHADTSQTWVLRRGDESGWYQVIDHGGLLGFAGRTLVVAGSDGTVSGWLLPDEPSAPVLNN